MYEPPEGWVKPEGHWVPEDYQYRPISKCNWRLAVNEEDKALEWRYTSEPDQEDIKGLKLELEVYKDYANTGARYNHAGSNNIHTVNDDWNIDEECGILVFRQMSTEADFRHAFYPGHPHDAEAFKNEKY